MHMCLDAPVSIIHAAKLLGVAKLMLREGSLAYPAFRALAWVLVVALALCVAEALAVVATPGILIA